MKHLAVVSVSLLLALVLGCAHSSKGPKPASQSDIEQIQRRASADLNCPAESVTVEVLEQGNMMRPWTFVAKGCEKSATYLSRMGTIIRN